MSNSSTIRDLTSIIIPCWNQIEITQQCIAALKSDTRLAKLERLSMTQGTWPSADWEQ